MFLHLHEFLSLLGGRESHERVLAPLAALVCPVGGEVAALHQEALQGVAAAGTVRAQQGGELARVSAIGGVQLKGKCS